MKVLVIGSRIPFPLHDGGAIATFNMLKGLSEAGVELSFAAINTKKHFVEQKTIERELGFIKHIHTFYIDTDVKILPALINIFSSNSYNIDRFYNKSFERELTELVSKNRFDLIHFEGLFVAAYAPAIRKACTSPLLLRQHNIEFNIWKTLAGRTGFLPKKLYLQMLAKRIEKFEKNILHHFDAVVPITENDEDGLRQIGYKGVLKTIPAGIEVQREQSSHHIYANSIYHIGSMEWMPNRQAMDWFHNDIWPLIVKRKPEAKFYMAGKNMPAEYLEMNSPNFHVLGEVENLHEFVRNKSILVVPLKSGSGIRIKTLEAMLAGKAVVSTVQGAQGLPVNNGEHCLIADSSEAFADAVIKLLDDHELRNRLADNGKRLALDNYGNVAVSRKWVEFYSILGGKSKD
jgi:glycosyltransferase involved in cell wall biosynthesis